MHRKRFFETRLAHSPASLLLACLFISWPFVVHAGNATGKHPAETAVVRLAADHVDSVLESVAASTRAVAGEFVEAFRNSQPVTPERRASWVSHRLQQGVTTLFQTWPGELNPAPDYQSDHVSWLSYQDTEFSEQDLRNLEIFATLTPAVRAAWHAWPFSWSYVTTADDWMMIYPFLTLVEAVNNNPPTRQAFYLAADFKHRKSGWTAPYLDLVGAGMMVTVSTPAYDGDTLLGVVSHDVTLAQLSATILHWVTRDTGGTAWLVDGSGLALGNSEPELTGELDESNRAAGAAVVYYRTNMQRPDGDSNPGQASRHALLNEVTDEVIERMRNAPENEVLHLQRKRHGIYGARVPATGWYLVWMTPAIQK